MGTAEEYLREGQLNDALAQLKREVQADPSDTKLRVFLFQLFALMGEWERSLNQLQVVGDMDAATLPMLQTYRELIRCEQQRTKVFSGELQPLIFGQPEQWVALLIESVKLGAEGNFLAATELREKALDQAPATPGKIGGQTFSWIADADTRLGPVLEAVVNGRYYWIPFANIKSMTIEEPGDLRDYVWLPVNFVWTNAGESVGFIPTRYPGSEQGDAAIRLSRKTQWLDQGEGNFWGMGQKVLVTDVDEYPLMDIREVNLQIEKQDSQRHDN